MNERILIVEDNAQNMRLLEMILSAKNYILLKAFDGEEALESAQKEHPDLIIMDMLLPRMSGLEATRRLRQLPAFSQTPIIAVTAYAMKGDREKALDAGCDAYLSKPINARELPRVIAQFLGQRKEKGT